MRRFNEKHTISLFATEKSIQELSLGGSINPFFEQNRFVDDPFFANSFNFIKNFHNFSKMFLTFENKSLSIEAIENILPFYICILYTIIYKIIDIPFYYCLSICVSLRKELLSLISFGRFLRTANMANKHELSDKPIDCVINFLLLLSHHEESFKDIFLGERTNFSNDSFKYLRLLCTQRSQIPQNFTLMQNNLRSLLNNWDLVCKVLPLWAEIIIDTVLSIFVHFLSRLKQNLSLGIQLRTKLRTNANLEK